MKKLTILLSGLFMLCLLACQSEMEFPEELSDVYTLQSISYSLEPGNNGIVRDSKIVGRAEVVNNGPEELPYTVSLAGTQLPEFSDFRIADEIPHRYIDLESLFVQVPIDIIDNEIVFSFFRREYSFNEKIETVLTSEQIMEGVTLVPAHTNAIIETKAVYHHLNTNFTALFIGEVTGEELVITGKWSGSFVTDITYTLTTSALK